MSVSWICTVKCLESTHSWASSDHSYNGMAVVPCSYAFSATYDCL